LFFGVPLDILRCAGEFVALADGRLQLTDVVAGVIHKEAASVLFSKEKASALLLVAVHLVPAMNRTAINRRNQKSGTIDANVHSFHDNLILNEALSRINIVPTKVINMVIMVYVT
jgi:hypothetical protein